eukprot:CAMPEP_0204572980 /NCGR_PEP_ID=MMETSP0661-20131031/39761_1 /ASSEMBLY_ACC=CAM_ASM_000606 /TAXON_ID=109239 /ORGANISM="Alexandrium margalefi, Strain AMGDE01CS-322" /LENGTH=89 /DNA_ID=CAMNT_0051581363 /DNA_START=45 /DNA_END=310 /DNA_ORIENTATION=-
MSASQRLENLRLAPRLRAPLSPLCVWAGRSPQFAANHARGSDRTCSGTLALRSGCLSVGPLWTSKHVYRMRGTVLVPRTSRRGGAPSPP